jgi:uncharacterized protein (DUF433 family)
MPRSKPPSSQAVPPESLEGDLVRTGDPRFGIIWINPDRMSGAPCFFGTRVPVQTLFDYIEGGDSIDEFLAGFPGVTREQAIAVLELARMKLFPASPRGSAA